MEPESTIWQISGGPASRSYADVFIRHGVGLIGPGDGGPWSKDRSDAGYDVYGFLRRFAAEAHAGDIVLLRTGMSRIHAVGLIVSDYLYLDQFDDVNGWDLQHARRVRWCKLPTDYEFGSPVFPGLRGEPDPLLARGDTGGGRLRAAVRGLSTDSLAAGPATEPSGGGAGPRPRSGVNPTRGRGGPRPSSAAVGSGSVRGASFRG